MKYTVALLSACLLFAQPVLAINTSETVSPGDSSSWSNSAKENASKLIDETTKATNKVIGASKEALDKTGKAASKGIDKTTKFINKTKDATKEGVKAFKEKFNGDSSKSTNDNEQETVKSDE